MAYEIKRKLVRKPACWTC